MNLGVKVGQKLMVGIRGSTLDKETIELLKEIQPGSIILFRRNITSAAQVKRLIAMLKELLPFPPLTAIDQEGGLVARFTNDITVFPGNMALGATGSVELAYQQGLITAGQLKDIGIDINLAPVIDVITTNHNPCITIRSFGDDPLKVSEFGAAYIQGIQMMKIAAVAKHFPGMGGAQIDAHLDLPVVKVSEHAFREIHWPPFRNAIENGVKGVMSTHIYCPSLDSKEKRPATFSPEVVGNCLRNRHNFHGVIFSDDLEMGAIARYYSIEDACIKTVASGHDILLICSDYKKQRSAFYTLLHAYQNSLLSIKDLDASVKRIQSLKNFCRLELDEKPSSISSREPQLTARQIADDSITLIADGGGLLPLKDDKGKRVVLIMPDLSTLDEVEEGYHPSEEHFFYKEFRNYFTGNLKIRFIPRDICPRKVEELLREFLEQDTVIAFIYDAQAKEGQRLLLKKLQKRWAGVIFVLVRNPFDVEFISSKDTCLITYGYRREQFYALLKVIFGKMEVKGNLPLKDRFKCSY